MPSHWGGNPFSICYLYTCNLQWPSFFPSVWSLMLTPQDSLPTKILACSIFLSFALGEPGARQEGYRPNKHAIRKNIHVKSLYPPHKCINMITKNILESYVVILLKQFTKSKGSWKESEEMMLELRFDEGLEVNKAS